MQFKNGDASLLLSARQRDAQGPCIVATVGLLCGPDNGIVAAVEAQKWLAERFSKQAYDHGLQKSRGSFAVHGSAYALSANQQQGMAVRASLGPLSKTLHVFPPRQWRKGLTGWSAESIGQTGTLPLDWQHAYGAKDYPDNPEGVGYIADPDKAEGLPLPQIEDPRRPLRAPGEKLLPASLLPLPPQSSERMAFLGTCDERWKKQRAPFLPLDTDPRWFDEVAQDQCTQGYWAGNEAWSVAGMHPQLAEVSGRLPGLRPRLFVQRRALAEAPSLPKDQPAIEPIEEARLELDTVWLFPDAERVLLLYRTTLRVTDIDGEDLAALGVGVERSGEPGKSSEQWIAELWPQAAALAVEAPPADLPPPPDVEKIKAEMLAKMQAALDARYASFAEKQAKVFAQAQQMAAKGGITIEPSLLKPVQAPNLAEIAKSLPVERPVFDPAAHKAALEAKLANTKSAAMQQFEQAAKKMGMDPQAMLAQAEAHRASVPPVDPVTAVDRLDLPPKQKAELHNRVTTQVAKFNTGMADLKTKLATQSATIAAARPKLPALSGLPTLKPRIVWTRELLEASHKAEEKLDGERFIDLDLSGIDLSGGVLQNCTFENCQFKGAKLTTGLFSSGRFTNCDFTQADLQQALFDSSTFKACTFTQAKLAKASLNAVHAEKSPFDGADLTQALAARAQFVDSAFAGATLPEGDFAGARWQRCDLSGVNLQEANLAKAQLHACPLDNADLRRAALPASSWSQVSGTAVNLSDANLQNWRIDQGCCLPALNLNNANLTKASLQYAGLQNATLRGANLTKALFSRCDLSHADGYHANASSADFTGSNLSHSSWLGANFLEARLRKVSLSNADLRGSNLHGLNSEGAHGNAVRLDDALMTRCRLNEDLAHG
ncbi:DUF2169 family type VI secretion system accessory protein [Pseudomonas sp. N040]|uniref:DUF2169 family type VI secretion system accessory protein n=1 Tax=Pseudomonas sp. N040 TaxID=2785325 RepID=UPI0018A2881C|nr:pentapeptide repeat-containing protein [Pseudomonas sp. N040]MBF7729562.1 DUF2169 domain-containing protein [Pseudomonas sp. N040]MBW7013202.1 pentapeptide repeat-containing protein [Pseudomonas sp. N040]